MVLLLGIPLFLPKRMLRKKQRKNERKKKPSKTGILKDTPNGKVPIKYLLQHLNCPISIFDFRKKKFIYVNDHFLQVTGLTADNCYDMSLEDFLACVESIDLLALQKEIKMRLENVIKQYGNNGNLQLNYSMNCRFKQKDGNFNDIMVQCTVIEWDKNNYPAVTLNVYTDLTPHKRDLKIVLTISIIGENEKQWKTVLAEEFLRIPKVLTEREHEIMNDMVHDIGAEEIAERLNLKYYTVRAHWRNILNKTGCHSQRELKDLAQKEGWV
jgi:DNA-binding CsgD family transcriptional regulator